MTTPTMTTIETIATEGDQISRRTVINTTASTLFDLVVNPYRHHELDGSGSVGSVISGDEVMQVGKPFKVKMKMFGIPYFITSTPTRVVQNEIVEWASGGGQIWRWEFRDLGDGRTEVTETWDPTTMRFSKFPKLIGEIARNARGIEATLQQLIDRYNTN